MKQQGNTAGSHCAYFYKKIRDASVPVALQDVAPQQQQQLEQQQQLHQQQQVSLLPESAPVFAIDNTLNIGYIAQVVE